MDRAWMPDPFGRYDYRWWNGSEWTNQVSKMGVVSEDAPVPAPPSGDSSQPHSAATGMGGDGVQWKPPRPTVRLGAGLLAGGGLVVALGTFLTWFTIEGISFNGYRETLDGNVNNPFGTDDVVGAGSGYLLFGLIQIGLGVTLFLKGRILPIAIVGVVLTAMSFIGPMQLMSDLDKAEDFWGEALETGSGLVIIWLGAAVSLGGAITALSRRRRWPNSTGNQRASAPGP